MKLTFLGTRGYIDPRSERHRRHSALLVAYEGKEVMVDCGADWLGEIERIGPRAIVLTHAHPDHAHGLKEGAPCPVYATEVTWGEIEAYPIESRETLDPREPVEVEGITFEAFPVEHSTRCPAVGYRIGAGVVTIFYVPDVVYIPDRAEAMGGAKLYVGDAATLEQSMVRRVDESLIGHTPLRTQLTWCRKEGVDRAIFTHCGSKVVEGDPAEIAERVSAMAEERGVEAGIAVDGQEVVLR